MGKAKVRNSNSSADVRKRISESLKKRWQDPAFRKFMMDKMAERKRSNTQHSAAHGRKISETMKRKWREDEENRNKAINGMARVTRKSIAGSRISANRKISEAMKQKCQDQEYRAAMTQKIRNSASDRTKKRST